MHLATLVGPAEDLGLGAKAGEQIDTATGEITQAAGDLLAGDSAAELQDRLNFVKQAARANGWDARLVAERDRLQAELDALAPAPDAGYMDRVSKRAKRIDAAQSSEEVAAAVAAAVAQTGAKGPADMGKLMAVLKPQLAGKADMAEVSKLVKAALAG